jgi:AcrR family transcriptional regulator
VTLLFEHGYEAMNTRQLAEASGLKSGSLYYHFRSKEDFLYRVLVDLLEEIVADLEASLDGIDEPMQRLEAYVRTLVRWHVMHRQETFIASIEVRSLSDTRHDSYMELRRRFDSLLAGILREGSERGVFHLEHPSITRSAILSCITGISGWYDPDGPFGLDEITTDFLALTRRMVGA